MLLRLKKSMPLSPKIKALRVNDNVLYFSKYYSHIRVGYSNFLGLFASKVLTLSENYDIIISVDYPCC